MKQSAISGCYHSGNIDFYSWMEGNCRADTWKFMYSFGFKLFLRCGGNNEYFQGQVVEVSFFCLAISFIYTA